MSRAGVSKAELYLARRMLLAKDYVPDERLRSGDWTAAELPSDISADIVLTIGVAAQPSGTGSPAVARVSLFVTGMTSRDPEGSLLRASINSTRVT